MSGHFSLIPQSDGIFYPAILHLPNSGDQDAALSHLEGYAHETEDSFALVPDGAWAVVTYSGGLLIAELFSFFAPGPLLRREFPISDEVYADLAEGVLLWTLPADTDPDEFWAQLENDEIEDLLLSIWITEEKVSYDLMVFDSAAAPEAQQDFVKWYEQQTDWPEERLPCPAPLVTWLAEMQTHFPNLNAMTDEEVDADEENEFPRGSDYSFGKDLVYVAFAWSAADEAYATMRELALKHGVGFYNVSGTGEIWRP